MKLFVDTSALVKYFHEEAGSERVTASSNATECAWGGSHSDCWRPF